ncbi:hypothetical protein BSKO_05757 [Bryopsis sp. KO-2023]|nr:hypothetical protein BSKO_05757 [Bryopsis sp. KO-2023]
MSGEPPVTPASSGRSDDCGTVPVLEQQNKPPPGPSTSEGCEEGVLVNRDCGASTSFGEYVERSASSDVVAPEAALPSFISPFSDVISGRRGNRAAEASRRRKPKDKVSSGSQVSENPAGDRFSPDRSRSPRRRPNQLHGNCNSSSTVQGTGDCLKIRPCSHRGVQESSEKPVASASPCGTAESPSGKSQNSVHNQGLTGDGRGMNLSKEEPPKKEDNAERILTHFDSWNFWRQNETVELKAEGGGFVSGTGASECLIICHEESDNAPETTITPPRSRHAVSRLSDPGASFSMEDMEQLEKKWSKEQTRGRRLQWYEHRRSGRWSSQNQTQPKQPDTPSNGLEPLCLSGAQMLPPKSLISNQSENDDTGSKHEGEEPLNQVVQTSSKPRGLRQTMSFPASIRSIPPTKQNNRGGAEYQMKVVSRGNGSPKMIKTAVPGTNFIRLEPSPRVSNPSQPSPSTQSGESDAIDEMLHDHRKRSDSDESFKKAASINRTPYFGRALMHISSEDGGGKEVNVGDDSFVSSKVDDLTMVGVKVHGAGWV